MNDDRTKWEFLHSIPTRDATDAELRSLADRLMSVARLSPWRDWSFANLALALVRDCVQYQLDNERVGREQIDGYTDPYTNPLLPYLRGVDDCDGKARLFVALCLAANIEAEMVPRWKDGHLAHVYAKCHLNGPNDPHKRWWFAETILRRARLGDVAEAVPKEIETGKWSF